MNSARNRRSQWRGRMCYLMLAIAAAGCGDEFRFDGISWQSERVRYHARRNDPLACADIVSVLERRSDRFAEIFGSPPSRWEPYDYYKVLDATDYENTNTWCAAPTLACEWRGAVLSPHPADEHELVHAYYEGLMGASPRFMQEGLAIGLSCASSFGLTIAPDTPIESALDPDGPQGPGPAARLVTALWFSGSPQQFYDLEAALGGGKPSRVSLAAVVSSVYGKDVDQIWSRARSKDGLECVGYSFCDAPPLELGETTLAETCTGRQTRRISDALAPALGIRYAGAGLRIAACDPTAKADPIRRVDLSVEWPWRFEHWFRAPNVPHALVPWAPDLALGAQTVVEVRDIGQAFAPTCDTSQPTDVAAGRGIRIRVPYEPARYHFPLRLPSMGALAVAWVNPQGASYLPRIRWCSACPDDPTATCVDLDAVSGANVTPDSPNAVLVIDAESELVEPQLLELAPGDAANRPAQ